MNRHLKGNPGVFRIVLVCGITSAVLGLFMLSALYTRLPPVVQSTLAGVQEVTAWLAVVMLLWWCFFGGGLGDRRK